MLLKDWLKREGMARKDFAARIGVAPSYVTALCDGICWPGHDVAFRIAKETWQEVTALDFIRPEEEAPTPPAAA